jgi:hypothetical protein
MYFYKAGLTRRPTLKGLKDSLGNKSRLSVFQEGIFYGFFRIYFLLAYYHCIGGTL